MTILRLNAETFFVLGTKERLGKFIENIKVMKIIFLLLVFGYEELLVSIGGYLGLFIGISLIDVFAIIFNFVENIKKKFFSIF